MKWGVWIRDVEQRRDRTHVAPTLDEDIEEDNKPMPGHVLHPECPCHPSFLMFDKGSSVWLHEVIQ